MANARPPVEIIPGIVFLPNCGLGNLTHAYVVVAVSGQVAFAVNWTDFFHYEESTCPLAVGDHPQITKASVMAYPRFKEFPTNILGSQLANGDLLLRLEDMKPHVLLRIIEGAQTSPDLTDEVKRRYGLIR